MAERNHGHFLITASQSGYLATAGVVDYAATKSAAIAIYEGLQTELKHIYKAPAVRVSVLNPIGSQYEDVQRYQVTVKLRDAEIECRRCGRGHLQYHMERKSPKPDGASFRLHFCADKVLVRLDAYRDAGWRCRCDDGADASSAYEVRKCCEAKLSTTRRRRCPSGKDAVVVSRGWDQVVVVVPPTSTFASQR